MSHVMLIQTMNDVYKEYYYNNGNDSFTTARKVVKEAKHYYPELDDIIDDIEFDGEKFFMLYNESSLPVGKEFYETDEDVGNEFY